MAIGMTMPIATTIDAGASIAAAVHPSAPSRSRGIAAAVIDAFRSRCEGSTLERLVPPLLESRVVLGQVSVVEVDQSLALLGIEADAPLGLRRDIRIGHARVVAHVLGERLLRRDGEHLVQPH